MKPHRVPSRWLIISFVVTLMHLALFSSAARADEVDDMLAAGNYVEGEVVAAFFPQSGQIVAQSEAPYEVTPLMRVGTSATGTGDGTLTAQSEEGLTLSSVTSATLTTEELLRLLSEDTNVAFVEPNYTFSIEDSEPGGATLGTGMLLQADATAVGDLKSMQWGNWTTDQTMRTEAFTANPSVNVPNFATSLRGANMSKPVVVALLDTAVDNQHPDLVNVLYHFTPEQQAALGCYETGYKAGNKGAGGNYYDPESVSIGHGTHTAGIIGAEWNGFGTSGVASDVRIVSIDFASKGGTVTTSDAICAFEFVDRFNKQASEDERIRITSNSWGAMHTSRAIDAAVRKLGEKWNTVSVFSAGNDGRDNDHYERANSYVQDNPYAVVVANSSGDEALNDSSEYGTASVDLAAPGTRILSTMTNTDAHAQYLADATRSVDPLYVGFDGDSEPRVTVSQLYQDDKPSIWHDDNVVKSDVGKRVDNVHACGSGSLKIDVDQSYSVDSSGGGKFNHYDVKFDVDLTRTDIADRLEGLEGLHLGLMFAGGKDSTSAMVWSLATNLANIEFTSGISPDSRADWLPFDKVITELQANDKTIDGEDPPTGAALHPKGDHLVIKLRVALPAGCTTFYVDSLGLGTQTSPYGFKTGTSMSTPVVSGAGAVLASQGHEGTELASLLRSKVRVPDPALAVKTGGIFDFLADGTTEPTDSHALGPDITGVNVNGTTVTITGDNFGAKPGSVKLARYVVGAEDQPLAATVASWADEEVRLALDAPIEGILRAVLTNSAGKWDTQYLFVSKGASVFEQDLPFDPSAGDAFVYGDAPGDWETKGPLVGLGCKLYHLPAYGGDDELAPGYSKMLCFDLKKQTWSELPALPEWLSGVSAVMHDGKIVVEGATMYELETGEHRSSFPAGEAAEERVYVFDPADGSWTKASADGMHLGQTIVNDDGKLKLAGGSMPDPEHPEQPGRTVPVPVTAYDPSSGAGDELCALPLALSNPQVAAHDKTLLICSDGMSTIALAPAVIRVRDGQATELKGALPAFVGDSETITYILFSEMRNIRLHCVLAPTSDGFVLVGPPAADGTSDTYVLRSDSDTFEPYDKRSSEDCVYSQAACTYRGRLFVIGASLLEPNNRLFRATEMEVPEYPGDIPCDPETADAIDLTGFGHVQTVGDVTAKGKDKGIVIGTEGQSRRLESFSVSLPKNAEGSIEYRSHVQRIGWEQSWAKDGAKSGTTGESRRIEAVQMQLSGKVADTHSVWYRVHSQTFGWLGWASDGQVAGTAGQSKRAEAIEVQVLPKGQAPADYKKGEASYVGAVTGSAHVQGTGWTSTRSSLKFGTEGKSKRLEAVKLSVLNQPTGGGISYEAHVQGTGWMPAAADGKVAGTEHQSKRVEAVRISLTGDMAKQGGYSVWYRVHSQTHGWLGWAHDGADAGTTGLSKRAEAIEVQILPQDQHPAGYDPSQAACLTKQ